MGSERPVGVLMMGDESWVIGDRTLRSSGGGVFAAIGSSRQWKFVTGLVAICRYALPMQLLGFSAALANRLSGTVRGAPGVSRMNASAAETFVPLARGFFLEGLLIYGDDVWFTDVTAGGVRRLGSDQVLLDDRTMIAGLLLNADGSLLVAGPGGIVWTHPVTGASGTLVTGVPGTNEMYPDGQGGMMFGTIDLPAILRGEKPGPSSIYRLCADRRKTLLCDGLAFANGLAIDADRSTLFFNESFAATRAFPIEPDGSLGEPRLLADKRDCDGMALDVDGNVWVSGFASGELICLRPDGHEVRRLPLPGKACSNVRFGGADMRDLYVTVIDPAAARALACGTPLKEQNSVLYRTRSPVAGAPVARTSFNLQ